MSRFHRIDPHRGYSFPDFAVAGASDTGHWDDSPCPSDEVGKEIARFRREALRPAGIVSRVRGGSTSNVFCGKRWVVVRRQDFQRAGEITIAWFAEHERSTRYLHTADLEALPQFQEPAVA